MCFFELLAALCIARATETSCAPCGAASLCSPSKSPDVGAQRPSSSCKFSAAAEHGPHRQQHRSVGAVLAFAAARSFAASLLALRRWPSSQGRARRALARQLAACQSLALTVMCIANTSPSTPAGHPFQQWGIFSRRLLDRILHAASKQWVGAVARHAHMSRRHSQR